MWDLCCCLDTEEIPIFALILTIPRSSMCTRKGSSSRPRPQGPLPTGTAPRPGRTRRGTRCAGSKAPVNKGWLTAFCSIFCQVYPSYSFFFCPLEGHPQSDSWTYKIRRITSKVLFLSLLRWHKGKKKGLLFTFFLLCCCISKPQRLSLA